MPQKYHYTDMLHPTVAQMRTDALPCRDTGGMEGVGIDPEKWHEFKTIRIRRYNESPRFVCEPLTKAPRFVIPPGSWVYENKDEMKRMAPQWRALDPEFEVIYDPLTSRGGPGYHLFRVIRNGYRGICDWLIHEFSIQRDIEKPWPQGDPCKPDERHIRYAREHMKSNRPGDAAAIHRAVMEDRFKAQLTPYIRSAKQEADFGNEVHETVTRPYILQGKRIPGLMKWRASQRNPRTPDLRLRFSSNVVKE